MKLDHERDDRAPSARQPNPQTGPVLQTIKSDIMNIERGSLHAGPISFQISNIASLEMQEGRRNIPTYDDPIGVSWAIAAPLALLSGCTLGLSQQSFGTALGTFVLVAAIAFFVSLAYFSSQTNPDEPHELRLLTNAASPFVIFHKDKDFIIRLKSAIEDAMRWKDDSVSYQIDKVEQKIERVVSASGPGAIATGGDIRDSTISTNAVVQGLQDISELIGIIEKLGGENAAVLQAHLEVVQSHLAGGSKTKAEAKAAWATFAEHVGTVAKAGVNVFELVVRIARLLS